MSEIKDSQCNAELYNISGQLIRQAISSLQKLSFGIITMATWFGVQDYHLMLLPALLKNRKPKMKV